MKIGRLRTRWSHRVVLLSLALAAACEQPPAPTELVHAGHQPPAHARMMDASRPDSLHPEAQMRRLARQIPGFGGWYFDADGDLNVWVTDPEAHGALARSVARTASEGLPPGRKPVYDVRVRKGQYEFLQLSAWRDRLEAAAGDIPDILWSDLDEARNRVAVGVASARGREAAVRKGRELGIPVGAMYIQEGEQCTDYPCPGDPGEPCYGCEPPPDDEVPITGDPSMVGSGTFNDRLDAEFSALRGGILTRFQTPDRVDACTIGLVIWTERFGYGFLTNSHCSDKHGGVGNTGYYQPNVSVLLEVGREVADPDYVRDFNCFFGWCTGKSRWSDAAFVKVEGRPVEIGVTARPSQRMGPGQGRGPITVNPARPFLRRYGDGTAPVGAVVDKIGVASGWTSGYVTATCKTVYQSSSRRHYCQDQASFLVEKGDSGGPAFVYRPATDDIIFIGLVHSGNGTYSPLIKVHLDLYDYTGNWGF